MNEKKISIYKINKFLCILFCIWFSWPYATFKLGNYFGIITAFLWLMTTGNFLLLNKWSKDLYSLLFFFLALIPYLVTGRFIYSTLNPLSLLGTIYLFFFGILVFHYYSRYKEDYKFLGKVALIIIFFYTLGSLQTYLGLINFPLASRILAQNTNPFDQEIFSNMGIGGFGFIYSSVFILLFLLYILLKQKKNLSMVNLFFLWCSFIIILTMILKASYTIAILMVIGGAILILSARKRILFYSLLLVVFLLLMIPPEYLGALVENIAKLFSNNSVVQEKLTDLSGTISGNYWNTSQTLYRLELYSDSLNTFFKYPLFGLNGSLEESIINTIGNHSGWLDLMAYFGLFVTIPIFFIIFFQIRKIFLLNKNKKLNIYLGIIYCLFLVFGFINPVIYVYNIGLIIFFVIPSMPYITHYLNRE